ncbi:MAG: ribosomal-processing cysteine protease Prp [Clostridiales bacterium]|jgi:uncharacterized protein YsxB (DUF464 family)|nr:ribosomal-processing cysteine protease Prp [Clostridiales bacterium]
MIQFSVFRNKNDEICGFEVTGHGKSEVCAGVSALALNTVNSIFTFTDEEVTAELPPDDETGYIHVDLPEIRENRATAPPDEKNSVDRRHDVDLLLSSLMLGIQNIQEEYPRQVIIRDEKDPKMII